MLKQPFSFLPQVLLTASTLALTASTLASAQAIPSRDARAHTKVSPALQTADDLGPLDPKQKVNLIVHLTSGDSRGLEAAVAELYNPESPNFHRWMTDAELKRYAPNDQQVETVKKTLERAGLTVSGVDATNLLLHASGTIVDAESAFHTRVHQFQFKGKTFRANTTAAHLDGEAEQYVSSVAGLESHNVHPMFTRALNLKTNKPHAPIHLDAKAAFPALNTLITDKALSPPTTYTFTTPGAALPVGVYFGNQYNQDPNLVVDFTASQLQAVYDLPAAYKQGLDGKGETIVLLEAYGDETIEADANVFSHLNGLPALNKSNFSIVYPEGKSPYADKDAALLGWNVEIALDVEWAHSIAPAAKILVVAAGGQSGEDFQYCMSYIIAHKLGYAVSDSWEEDLDLLAGPAEQQSYENILEIAAAKGISFQFSSGDSGDNGVGDPLGAPGLPSNAPHATGVGGTAILNKLTGGGFEPVGWGDTLALLDAGGVFDPPAPIGLVGGAGGGESIYFPKPSWQKSLPGKGRQVPDVSALADPYTGVPVVVTSNGAQELLLGVGGTSLASPIFTAFWTLAQQKAGGPLGQAAPLIAGLKEDGIQDVVPISSPTNVAGTIFDANGPTFYSPSAIFGGPQRNGFISAVWNLSALAGEDLYYDFAFGLDGSLTVAKGWDNVTGYGTPSGLAFIDAVAKAAKKK